MDTEIESSAEYLAEKASAIRRLAKNITRDVVEIGGHLIEAKALVGHGNWLEWLEREFQWSERTARHYMGISELAKTANFADLEPLDISSLYLLAAPSTPECARDEVAERVRGGERPAYNEIRHIVQAAKSTPLCLPLAPIIGESRPFVQAVRTTLGQMESSVSNLIAEGRASAAVDALLRFGQSEIDADAVRSYLARSGRTREFFQAVSKAVALRHELEPRPPRPDYLKPI